MIVLWAFKKSNKKSFMVLQYLIRHLFLTGLETPVCGDNKPGGIYVTDNMQLTIRFTENTTPLTGQNIMAAIIITDFTNRRMFIVELI